MRFKICISKNFKSSSQHSIYFISSSPDRSLRFSFLLFCALKSMQQRQFPEVMLGKHLDPCSLLRINRLLFRE